MARAMKDSGIAWIGEIPEEWETNTVFQLFTQVKNKNEGLKEQNLLSLSYGKIKRKSIDTTEGLLPESFDGYNIIEAGDIVLRLTDLQNDQRSLRVGLATERGIVTSAYLTIRNRSKSIPRYLYYYLHSFDICKGFYCMGGGVRQGLNWDGVKWVKVLSPSVEEQKRIADYLDAECARIDAVIEQTRASIEEYKKLKQAVITQAVTKGIRPNRPMKDSGIDWIAQIPEEWDALRGKWLFHETDERSEDGSEELLTVSHITGVTPRSQKNVNMFMSESFVGYKICSVNDIAANTMWMWQGAIGVSKYHGVISPSYNTYRQTNNQYNPDYLDYLLRIRPLVDTYNANSTGITASRLRLYPDRFLSILFPIPPMNEQIEIAAYLNEKIGKVGELIKKKEQYLSELENYKKSMIFEHVTGKMHLLK